MKHKLKYINLFEDLTTSELNIPDAKSVVDGYTWDTHIYIKIKKYRANVDSAYDTLKLNSKKQQIKEILIEGCSKIKKINSFNSLDYLHGDININDNNGLEEINSFKNLKYSSSKIEITNNNKLERINSFDVLESVHNLRIENNENLKSITGFENLERMGGGLNIINNKSLLELPNFQSLIETNLMIIRGNDSLETIHGRFQKLKKINSVVFDIQGNSNLLSIDDFKNLKTMGGNFSIRENKSLKEINGFDNLEVVHGNFYIGDNPELIYVNPFPKLQTIKSWVYLYNNDKYIGLSFPLVGQVNYRETSLKFASYLGIYFFNSERGRMGASNDNINKSPEDFVNNPVVIQDCIDKFNPDIHDSRVIKQICNNLESWGTDETKERVYSVIAPYCTPEQLELLPDMYRYLYDPKYNNTGAKSVTKVATGVTYGLF